MTIDAMFTQFPRLKTDRLLLRQIQLNDAEALFSTFSDEEVTDDINEHSKCLLRKLGFTHEGTLRLRFYFRGRFWDEHYFGLLKDEWH